MKLSKYINNNEERWKKDNLSLMDSLIQLLESKIGINLYEKSKVRNSSSTYNLLKVWLLVFYKEELYLTLQELNINKKAFIKNLITSLILTLTREKSNINIILKALIDANIIISYNYEASGNFVIESNDFGTLFFKKASEFFNDSSILEYMKKNNIESDCHESAMYLLKKYKHYTAVTAICVKSLNNNYYHSFCLDKENNVIDLTANLIMGKDLYYLLYEVKELSIVNWDEYRKIKNQSKEWDESGTLMPLLRIAAHKELLKNKK